MYIERDTRTLYMYVLYRYLMGRTREVDHPDGDLYWEWSETQRSRGRTGDQYMSDVARFLREHVHIPLDQVTETTIRDFREPLSSSQRTRMTSALSSFFHFALERGRVVYDPVYYTKYGRRASLVAQVSLFDALRGEGIGDLDVRGLVWEDFVAPLVQRREALGLRVRRRTLRIGEQLWHRLERRFRELSSTHELLALMRRKIAS